MDSIHFVETSQALVASSKASKISCAISESDKIEFRSSSGILNASISLNQLQKQFLSLIFQNYSPQNINVSCSQTSTDDSSEVSHENDVSQTKDPLSKNSKIKEINCKKPSEFSQNSLKPQTLFVRKVKLPQKTEIFVDTSKKEKSQIPFSDEIMDKRKLVIENQKYNQTILQTPNGLSLKTLAAKLKSLAKDNMEKGWVIFCWISHNISYDSVLGAPNSSSSYNKDCSAEGVLKSGISVCEGYANLFQALAELLDLFIKYSFTLRYIYCYQRLFIDFFSQH